MKRILPILFLMLVPLLLRSQTGFSQDEAYRVLKVLAEEIGPRPMGSPSEQAALRFAEETFLKNGCDTSYTMLMDYTDRVNTTSGIAVGIHRGTTGRSIVIGAHIDSSDPEVQGANDDGSGTAVVLEIARTLSKYPTESTLIFCCFGGEERGLEGSRYFTRNFAGIDSIVLMLQADMADGAGVLNIDPDSHGASAPPWLFKAVVEEYTKLGYTDLVYPHHFFTIDYALPGGGAGSDHEPFLEQGIPAVDFTSDVNTPIHTARDNMENFDPSGLKRTGDLIVNLVRRFDHGIPERSTGRNLFYLTGTWPVVIPLWSVRLFCWAVAMLTIVVIASLRQKRITRRTPGRIRWSGIKMVAVTAALVSAAWFSPDIIGLLKGIRHPWLISYYPYLFFAGLAAVLAGMGVLKVSGRIGFSTDPYVYFIRSAIILLIALIILGIFRVELMLGPAFALLCLSLAVLIPNPWIRIILTFLAPCWMMRLIFSEWSILIFRMSGGADTTSLPVWLLMNGIVIAGWTIWILPFTLGFAAVVRTSLRLHIALGYLRLWQASALTGLFLAATGSFLLMQPDFNSLWHRNIRCEEQYTCSNHRAEITLKCSEYLRGVRVEGEGIDTTIGSGIVSLALPPGRTFDTSLVSVERHMRQYATRHTTRHVGSLHLTMMVRPLHVAVTFDHGSRPLEGFETPWKFRTLPNNAVRIEFDSFPDSLLEIPVTFLTSDSVKETIEVTFNREAQPFRITGDYIDIIPRTKFLLDTLYRSDDRTIRASLPGQKPGDNCLSGS